MVVVKIRHCQEAFAMFGYVNFTARCGHSVTACSAKQAYIWIFFKDVKQFTFERRRMRYLHFYLRSAACCISPEKAVYRHLVSRQRLQPVCISQARHRKLIPQPRLRQSFQD
jgi:hypothetical protein